MLINDYGMVWEKSMKESESLALGGGRRGGRIAAEKDTGVFRDRRGPEMGSGDGHLKRREIDELTM
jgi:hypothetical protein